MNRYVDVFLKEVLGQVRYKKAHPYLAQELNDHIELFKEELMEEGLGEDEAYQKAVQEMGEPIGIGKGLHKLHRPKMEWGLLLLIFGLISIGFLAIGIYGANVAEASNMLQKQMIYSVLGILSFLVVYFMDYRKIEKFSLGIYLMGIMVIILTLLFGIQMNGVKRWIAIGPFAVQATNIAIPLLMIGYAGCVRKWANRGIVGYVFLGTLAVSAIFLCMVEQLLDGVYMGVALLGIFVIYIMSPAFKGNRKQIGILLITALTAIAGSMIYFITSREYRMNRLIGWIWPQTDPYNTGYLPMNIREVLQGAGWFGNKEMLFIQNTKGVYVKVPAGNTDFIFTSIIGMMGWLVAIGILIVVGTLLVRCFKSARKTRDEYGRLILYGISILFTTQYMLSILMNVGISPIGGMMPFIAYGGSKLVCDMTLLGFFLGIYRRKDILIYELLDTKKITKEQEINKVGRKSWLLSLAINILRTSDEIEEVEVRFKERT